MGGYKQKWPQLGRAWSSGRVLDCRRDGRGFEPHQRHLPCSRPSCCLVMGTLDETSMGVVEVVGVVYDYITGVCSTAPVSVARLSLPLWCRDEGRWLYSFN